MTGQQIALAALMLTVPILPTLWSIWHAHFREFPSHNEKMIWLGVCVFVPVIGGIIYILFGRRRGVKPLR